MRKYNEVVKLSNASSSNSSFENNTFFEIPQNEDEYCNFSERLDGGMDVNMKGIVIIPISVFNKLVGA